MAYNGITATIPAGRGGYNGSDNPDSIPYTDLVVAKNIRYDGGSWRKVPGLQAISNAVANTPTCLSGIDYKATTAANRQVTAWDNGWVYKEVSGTFDAVQLNPVKFSFKNDPIFVPCGQEAVGSDRKLLMFAKDTPPQVIVGDAAAGTMVPLNTETKASLDWVNKDGAGSVYTYMPSAGLMHDSRVACWGNQNSPHSIYFSTLTDHTDFRNSTNSVALDVVPGEGDGIRACYPMGTTRLYVFKYPVGVYWIDTSNIAAAWIPATKTRGDIGIAGPNAITRVGSSGTWFIGSDGHIYSLNLLDNPDVDIRDASITGQMFMSKWIKDNVDTARLYDAKLVWDPNRKEVLACYTSTDSNYNDIVLVIDLQNPQQPKLAMDERGPYYEAAWIARDESTAYRDLLVAGTGGIVYKANWETRSIGTVGYSAEIELPPTDFAWVNPKLAQMRKRFDWVEFTLTGTQNSSGYVKVIIDGDVYETYSFQLGSGGTGFILDDVRYGLAPCSTKIDYEFGSPKLMQQKIRIGGTGQRLALNIYNNEAGEDFNISSVRIYMEPLGELGQTAT